jgi:DNA invertase Pin-like site-specific DNA recombinase
MSDKITSHHVGRRSVLYIRQSSSYQVAHNLESQRMQYAMKQRLHDLGWADVEVIDEDLGRSAAGGVTRAGFERMVASVCLGQIGAVAAREVSRFARNSRDWQQLIEVCRMVDTLLVDHEMIYDPRRSNDRLLLGLKGSMNEYELDLLRQRSWEARRRMIDRGELVVAAPIGFTREGKYSLVKDPDRRVQEAIDLIFRKFLELGSVRQVLLWMIEHDLMIPARHRVDDAEQVVWQRPRYGALYSILTSPSYGGAYAFGRTQSTCEFKDGQTHRRIRRRARDQWLALIPDRHEGYIGWDQFQRIQQMIASNSQTAGLATPGAAKRGVALLAGLLRCGRCGRKLTVQYSGRHRTVPRYACRRGFLDNGEPKCIGFGGTSLDEAVTAQVFELIQPGAIEAVRAAMAATRQAQEDLLGTQRLELQAAQYAAERAHRQFDAVDPTNRLVADELEKRWNAQLQRVVEVEQKLHDVEVQAGSDSLPTEQELLALAHDLPQVWNDPQTDVRLKKRILRSVVQEVVVDVDRQAGTLSGIIHWKGGVHTQVQTVCRRRGQSAAHTPSHTIDAVAQLARICCDTAIAGLLNRNGLRTGRGNRWTKERVASLRSHHRIPIHDPQRQLQEGWLNLTDAAAQLQVSPRTLRLAAERADVTAIHPLNDGPWLFQARDLDPSWVLRSVRIDGRCNRRGAIHDPNQLTLDSATTWRGEAL